MGLENPSASSLTTEMCQFTILKGAAPVLAPRLGRLVLAGRKPISTPHFVPLTSRGTVAHLSHDVMRDQTSIASLYCGLEDFIEKDGPAVYKVPCTAQESPLRKFICMPDEITLVLGPRRAPPVPCPVPSTNNSVSILTSVGFRQLPASEWVDAVQKLRPDIVVGMADLATGTAAPGVKRRGKMVDRTHAYTRDATERLQRESSSPTATTTTTTTYFAPVLPLENTEQTIYLADLESELRPAIAGLALYESASLGVLPPALGDLPRLVFSEPATPHEVLRDISLGADLLTLPFVGALSDAGIALDFVFPSPSSSSASPSTSSTSLPLARDLWSDTYTTDVSPLSESCNCYTCRNHHRAYLHHLLAAKEMLAWTLLQIHNHAVVDAFFAAVRASIERETFESDIHSFARMYEPDFPDKTGQGPRYFSFHSSSSSSSSSFDISDYAGTKSSPQAQTRRNATQKRTVV
ncbi:hypothetical protein ASPZODRAFT_140800 [Penicilliopsis zonata CBS 506.65]|uniref:Queuine tRNA-ribosyltransferase accessory subunit 2 n=1 Tax=Penicilliopsis zonata CBS 506.65 TaxID=1073090 RepID=A0A1L9SMS9_9EURO|nr:hypothetical protein ASPZODRAFT_140800 [Penicilliopsis zonata CBS 506.65]OJJ48510.1 hypothetical protein ASPZODRAFT_140800 [Penicilliopsis zonata CBS 506.65]